MTTQDFPKNKVLVVGRLYRAEGKDGARKRSRNALGGRVTAYDLQTCTPAQEVFSLPLALASGTVQQALGPQLTGGQVVVLEGEVRVERSLDPRFAPRPTDPTQRGLDTRDLVFHPRSMRLATPDEAQAGSAVWIDGVVAEPPTVVRHPAHPGMVYELTTLRVTVPRPSPIPGSAAVVHDACQVLVAIATNHPDAGLLRRVGNRVQVEGQLDELIVERRGELVQATVAALDTAYTAERASPEAGRDLAKLNRHYRGQLRNLLDHPRLLVVVAAVTGRDDATPAPRQEAQQARQLLTQRRRQQRERRAARQAAASEGVAEPPARETPSADAAVVVLVTPPPDSQVTPAPVVSDAASAALVPPLRPRARAKGRAGAGDDAGSAASGLVTEAETPSDAGATDAAAHDATPT